MNLPHPDEIALGVGVGLVTALVAVIAHYVKGLRAVPPGAFLAAGWGAALALESQSRLEFTVEPRWILVVAVVAFVAVVPALIAFDRRYVEYPVAPILLLGTIGGAFLATPDTEVLVLLGAAAAPVVAVSLLWKGPYFGVSAAPIAAVLIWAIAHEARGRPASAVGALACWGLIVVEPAVQLMRKRLRAPLALVAGHAAFVFLAARWAGLERDLTVAVLEVASLTVAATVVMALAFRPMPTNGRTR